MSYIAKSPWVIHYDGSSCNGCDIEVLACLTPMYDVERFGIINTGNPKHADVFLVTGSVNEQNKDVVKQIYEQMPEPKVVVAVGICACSGGVFKQCYNILGGVDTVIPVDVYVPGCAARPEAIIDGVVKGLAVLQEKRDKMVADMGAAVVKTEAAAEEKEEAEAERPMQRKRLKKEGKLMSERVFVEQNFTPVEVSQLLTEVKNLKADGYRFAQACATVVEDKIEIIYSFDKSHYLKNLKITISQGEEVESITGDYWPAFIYENEMHDLFGVKFNHSELDYQGNFFKVAEPTPWSPKK